MNMMNFVRTAGLGVLLATGVLSGCARAPGDDPRRPVLETYAAIVLATYEDTLQAAKALDASVDALLAAPSEQTLADARDKWRAARIPYGQSEAFRFYGGPIDREGRPHVRFKEVSFDPKTRTFTLTFEKGGSATVRIAKADTNRMALDVAFDKGIENGPFAMLRSMYVTEFNNDMARIAVREREAKGWREENIMKFGKAHATDIWMGRLSPSQHNTSSPDVVFNSFSDGPYPKRPKSEPPPTIVPKKAE